MRDLNAILCDHSEADRRSIEAADALLVKLEEASRADAAVNELRAVWVRPWLAAEHGDDLVSPRLSLSFLSIADAPNPTDVGTTRCTKRLAGRALADELLDREPSFRLWQRAHDLVRLVSRDEFTSWFARRAGTPQGTAWNALLAKPPEEPTYPAGASPAERETIRRTSTIWRAAPRVLGEPSDRDRVSSDAPSLTRLGVLACLDRSKWFGALRQCAHRTELELALRSASQRPDELIRLLREAPVAIDQDGTETGDVAAIVLARRAWSYATEVASALDQRMHLAVKRAEREKARDDARTFSEAEAALWFERVWTTIMARSDGGELALALAVEQVAGRVHTREHRTSSVMAERAQVELENRVAALWRPRIDAVPGLLDQGDVGRHLGLLPRWLAYARIALDDTGDLQTGAKLAWSRLVDVLVQCSGDRVAIPPHASISDFAWCTVALTLARVADPAGAFGEVFDRLWIEREQARMGVRVGTAGSTLPLVPVASRFVLAGAARTVSLPPSFRPLHDVRALWLAVFAALLECWPSFEDCWGEDSSIAKFVCTCGALRHRAELLHAPTSAGLVAELEEALRFAKPDAVFTVELAALWLKNGWPAQEILAFFMRAGIDLDATSAGLLVDTSEWLREREAIAKLRMDLAL